MLEVFKEYSFDSAHMLPNVPPNHKCARIHGHTFIVTIHVSGDLKGDYGWVEDYADISAVVKPIIERLDHQYLNDIKGLENPTSENLAQWIWAEVVGGLPGLSKIIVKENPAAGCIYTGH